jgi:hypothetical protein
MKKKLIEKGKLMKNFSQDSRKSIAKIFENYIRDNMVPFHS